MTGQKDETEKKAAEALTFDVALREALESASQADVAKKDILTEVAALASAVSGATQGELTVVAHSGSRKTAFGVVTTFAIHGEHSDPEDVSPASQSVLIVPKRDGTVSWDLTRELCRLIPSAAGYPVRVDGPEGTIFAEDRDGLHSAFYDVSRHPKTGLKIRGLRQQIANAQIEGAKKSPG